MLLSKFENVFNFKPAGDFSCTAESFYQMATRSPHSPTNERDPKAKLSAASGKMHFRHGQFVD